ncbi:MAG: ATP-binding protein [Elusimicrobiota bacterium]|jgi:signal transduction histidine kinase
MSEPEIERSRALMRRTLLEMESLRRSAGPVEMRRRFSGPRAWRLLRRTLERFQQLLGRVREGAWPDPGLAKPEWERRRRELEARGLRAESAQRELEAKRRASDADWERVSAELESLQEGWLLLARELPPGDPSKLCADLQERLSRMEGLFGELLEEEAQLQRERAMVDRLWRWLVGVWLPSAEEGLPQGADQSTWSSLRRRIQDLDRRWRGSLSDLKRVLTEEEVSVWRERMQEAERRAESLSRDLLALHEGRRIESLPGSMEPQLKALQKDCDELRARLREEQARREEDAAALELLRGKLASQAKVLESAREKKSIAEIRTETLAKELSGERAQRAAAEEASAGKDGRISALEQSLHAAQDDLRALQTTTGREEELLRQAAAMRVQLEDMESEGVGHNERIEQLRTQNQAALRERRRALQDREAAMRALEASRKQGAERLEQARDAWFAREKDLRGKLGALQESLEKLGVQSEREKAALRSALSILQSERDEWRRRVNAAVEEFDARQLKPLREEHERVMAELAKQKQRYDLDTADERSKRSILEGRLANEASLSAEEKSRAQERLRAAGELAASEKSRLEAERETARQETALEKTRTAQLGEELQQARLAKDSLESRLCELEAARAALAATVAAAAAPGEPEPETQLPSVEPVLEPAWSRVVERLRSSLGISFGHLRRLSAARLGEGQKALLKLAAGEIAKSQDTLRVLSEYLEEPPLSAPSRIETVLDAALSAWEPALRRRRIALSRRLDPLAQAKFHPETLRMAFYQLLRNAYEAMPRGGALTVRTETDASGRPCVLFSDTGPGFTQEALSRVFEPFASGKPGHLGLGLAFARRTAARFGGDVSVQNSEGVGAVVRLSLAAAGEPEEAPAFEPSDFQSP